MKTEDEKLKTKELARERAKKWYHDNKEKAKLTRKLYTERTKDERKKKDKIYREKNPDKIKKTKLRYLNKNANKIKETAKVNSKKYRENHPDKIKKYTKEYRKNNSEKLKLNLIKWRSNNKDYNKIRKANDPLFKLKLSTRSMIYKSLHYKLYRKTINSCVILGCSFEDFKRYLESKFEPWMNWDNYGNPKDGIYELNKTWDIDHTVPLTTANTKDEIMKLNHYTNLQPLCSYTNRFVKKGVRIF